MLLSEEIIQGSGHKLLIQPEALWAAVPALAATVTYPWQLFDLVGPLLAFLAGSVLIVERRLALLSSLAGLLAFVVLSSAAAMTPRFTQVDPGPAPVGVFGVDQVTLLTATAFFWRRGDPRRIRSLAKWMIPVLVFLCAYGLLLHLTSPAEASAPLSTHPLGRVAHLFFRSMGMIFAMFALEEALRPLALRARAGGVSNGRMTLMLGISETTLQRQVSCPQLTLKDRF